VRLDHDELYDLMLDPAGNPKPDRDLDRMERGSDRLRIGA
jgi:hypothetical protein